MSNGFDRLRRGWTHRRLGLGRTRPSAAALAHADALLTEVAGRIPDDLARDLAPDPVRVALLDFVADVDLTVETGLADEDFDAAAFRAEHPIEMQRIERTPTTVRRSRVRDRFLLPAMSAATAAVVLIAVFVVSRGTNDRVGTPSTAAATESATLLQHASLLLDAANSAQPTQRTELVREARSDLQHVDRLLPLISAPNRPPLRSKLQSLERQTTATQTRPTEHPARSGSTPRPTSGSGSGSGATTKTTPPASKHQPSHTVPPTSGSGTGSTSGNHHPTGSGSGGGTAPTTGEPQGASPLGPGHYGQSGQGGQGRGGQGGSGQGGAGGPLGPGFNAAR